MNKALLTVVCAASIGFSAMAATPIDLTAEITTGSTVETLQMFNIKFLKDGKQWVGMDDGAVTINQEKRVKVKGGEIDLEPETQLVLFGSIVNIRLPQVIRRPGEYEVIVPEGLVSYQDECNKALTIKVTVTGSTATMTQNEYMQYFVMDPADGTSLSSLGSFTLISTSKFELGKMIDATLKTPNGDIFQSAADLLADDTQAQYRFNAPANEKGAYVLTIPEGVLRSNLPGVGSITNPELVFNYTVKGSQQGAFAVDMDIAASPLNPSLTAESYSSFFLNITDGDDAYGPFIINSDLIEDVVVQTPGASFSPSAVVNVDGDPKAIELRFATPITAGGDYTVILPEGLLSWENFINTRLVLENAFTCTGEVVDYFSALKWFSGSEWASRQEIGANFEVISLTSLFGTFDNIPSDINLSIPTEGVDEDELGTSRATIVLPSGETLKRIISPVAYDNHSFKISVSFDVMGYREEGEYKVTIPAGSFLVNGIRNPEINQTFVVADNRTYTPVDLGLVSSPLPDVAQNDLRYISWTVRLIDEENQDLYSIIGLKPNSKITVTPKGGTPFEVVAESYNNSYDAGFAIDLKPDITANGEYVVSIPEGVYRLRRLSDGQLICNRAEQYTYIVENSGNVTPSVNPTITPAPGSEMAALSRFELYRPSGYTMYLPEPVKNFTLTLPSGETVEVEPTTNNNVAGEYIFVYLPEAYSAPGEYKLTIPNGGIEFYAGETPVGFPGYSYTYTVKDYTPADLAFTADPVDGSSIYWLGYTYVKFDETVKYTTGVQARLVNPDNESSLVTTSFNTANNRLMLTYGYNDKYGDYTFIIPQGIVVTEDGRTNKEIKLSYKFVERVVEKIPFIVDPKEGLVGEFQRVTITAPEGYNKIGRLDHDNTKVELTIDEEDPIKVYLRQEDDHLNSVYIELEQPLSVSEGERKDITLALPEGILTLYAEDGTEVLNASTRFNWRLDPAGVAEIFGSDALFTVYTLDGVCVLRNAEADALNALDKGTYIINGKTVILR